jgi:hypothetical protein
LNIPVEIPIHRTYEPEAERIMQNTEPVLTAYIYINIAQAIRKLLQNSLHPQKQQEGLPYSDLTGVTS